MKLKAYQKEVIEDLSQFLPLLVERQSIEKSYSTAWQDKGGRVGLDGMCSLDHCLEIIKGL